MERPYISLVVAGRNDDYGGDFNDRLQNSIASLARYVEQYRLPLEYIIVNYNPISTKKSLYETLKWPKSRKYLTFRIITVPNEVHQLMVDLEIRDKVPLYEYIAKNTGIRRAKGEFVAGANPDIIYTPEIIQYLSKRKLQEDYYYRADRCDFHKLEHITPGELPEDIIPQLQKSAFRVFLKGHVYPIGFNNFFYPRLWWLKYQNQKRLNKENAYGTMPPEFHYHCNCSGDFMMMHRSQWERLKGHPENTRVAAHTDSLFVIVAAAAGLKEKVFDYPVYHQNHDRRYTCDAEEVNPSVEAMYQRHVKEGNKMLKDGKPIIYNDDNWGLAQYDFHDIVF